MKALPYLLISASVVTVAPAIAQPTSNPKPPQQWDQKVQVPVTNLALGNVVPGILDRTDPLIAGRYMEAFRFTAAEGTPVQIKVVGSTDDRPANNLSMVPYILVFGPNNELIARTGVQPNTVTAYVIARLPATGAYTILVSGIEQRRPGRFSLSLRQVAPDAIAGMTLPMVSDRAIGTSSSPQLRRSQPERSTAEQRE